MQILYKQCVTNNNDLTGKQKTCRRASRYANLLETLDSLSTDVFEPQTSAGSFAFSTF